MFKLSRKGEYALRAVFHLAQANKICTVDEIAKMQNIPQPFLKKIIQSLRVGGIVNSVKGYSGGVSLNVSPEKLNVKDVVEKIEGPLLLNDCLVYEGYCNRDKTCPLHDMWQKCQDKIIQIWNSSNFAYLVNRQKELHAINDVGIEKGSSE